MSKQHDGAARTVKYAEMKAILSQRKFQGLFRALKPGVLWKTEPTHSSKLTTRENKREHGNPNGGYCQGFHVRGVFCPGLRWTDSLVSGLPVTRITRLGGQRLQRSEWRSPLHSGLLAGGPQRQPYDQAPRGRQ